MPCVVLPIVTANIINDITSGSPDTIQNIIIQAIIMVALVVLNVPMNYLYTRYKSLATRYAETGLRKALVRKLQAAFNFVPQRDTVRQVAIKDNARCGGG